MSIIRARYELTRVSTSTNTNIDRRTRRVDLACPPRQTFRPTHLPLTIAPSALGGPSHAAQPLSPSAHRRCRGIPHETAGRPPRSPVSIFGTAPAWIAFGAFGNFRPPRASRDPTSSGVRSIPNERELIGQIKFLILSEHSDWFDQSTPNCANIVSS